MRPGVGPQRVLQQHQLRMQQQQQQAEDITYSEFQLVSTSKRGKNHVMDFKSSKHVEPKNFARPVKLHRKETNFLPYRQYIQNLNEQNAAAAAAKEAAAANAAAIMAGTPLPHPAAKPTASDVEELGGDAPTPSTQNQHGPKTGADTSLIAPLGGATRNKQMLFKKRTKQIYLAKEDTRELKEQEQRPWILEDYDGQNSFTGTYEGGQRSDYMFFVLTVSEFPCSCAELAHLSHFLLAGEWIQSHASGQMVQVSAKTPFQDLVIRRSRRTGRTTFNGLDACDIKRFRS